LIKNGDVLLAIKGIVIVEDDGGKLNDENLDKS